MHRLHLATAVAAIAAGTVAISPAGAASKPPPKPKPFHGSKDFTDQTPDPTESTGSGTNCSDRSKMPSQYPVEAPLKFTIQGPGKFKVSLNNKLDWAVEIQDSKHNPIASSDGGTPTDVEGTSAKIKKAGVYYILPCNLGGEPTVTVTWSYTPS